MRTVFQHELSELSDALVEVGELVQLAITDATTAFRNTDIELAEEVLTLGSRIDEKCRALDETAIDILARQAPVASDLKLVVTALRISSSLERMGDLALHIANLARYRFPERAIPKGLKKIFTEMGAIDVEIAGLLVQMLSEQHPALLTEIDELDDKVDNLHVRVFEKVLSDGMEDTASIVDATLASRYHERFGDHAVSIAQRIIELIPSE
ncbi:phosphate signaling complex protein PhoU [Leucobacter sp. UCMA 4100]|uniref:phosphate signaling complex protein PhoU n=1 Tax=Leucobacter TaxID=55968 RepID=UPI001C2151BA|nr:MULTISPECIES: phosphate signaling complex protein PhoU [Leucobacter]MDA3146552.1 phosphate signaling complex protein PhoU [Leucobacter sp. UCMA 4100]